MRLMITLLALVVALVLPGRASAAEDSPMDMLKKTNEKITKLLDKQMAKGSEEEKKRDADITKIVDGLLDLEAIAKSALGKNWAERTDQERKDFVDTFKNLIQKNYLKQIHEKAQYEMIYNKEEVLESKATVDTTVKATNKSGDEAETAVVYKLHKIKGKWSVLDIETDEVSLVQNYRSQFNKIITKDGFPALLEKMRKKIESDAEGDKI